MLKVERQKLLKSIYSCLSKGKIIFNFLFLIFYIYIIYQIYKFVKFSSLNFFQVSISNN